MDSGLMQPLRLSKSVWRLGSYHAAAYLLRGDGVAALFEVGVAATAPLILAQLDALGLPRDELRYLIISHAHADHVTGQAALMAALPGAKLCLTPGARAFLQKPSTARRFAREDAHFSGEVARLEGLPGPLPSCLPLLPPPLREIEAGSVLDLGGLEVRFLAADGHVPDGLICHLPGEGLLLASDSAGYCPGRRPGFPLYYVSRQQYLETLETIASLEPVILGLAHHDSFQGPAVGAYLRDTREHLDREHQGILKGLAAGQDQEALAQDMFNRYYHDDLMIYPQDSIIACCRLLVRRSWEDSQGA